jgi:ribosomal protein S14
MVYISTFLVNYVMYCRVIAQAVSRRLPTAAAKVLPQVRSCEICGGQNGTGTGFLRVLRFPLPNLISLAAPYLCIDTCYLESQPIQRFVATQQLRKYATVMQTLLGTRTPRNNGNTVGRCFLCGQPRGYMTPVTVQF